MFFFVQRYLYLLKFGFILHLAGLRASRSMHLKACIDIESFYPGVRLPGNYLIDQPAFAGDFESVLGHFFRSIEQRDIEHTWENHIVEYLPFYLMQSGQYALLSLLGRVLEHTGHEFGQGHIRVLSKMSNIYLSLFQYCQKSAESGLAELWGTFELHAQSLLDEGFVSHDSPENVLQFFMDSVELLRRCSQLVPIKLHSSVMKIACERWRAAVSLFEHEDHPVAVKAIVRQHKSQCLLCKFEFALADFDFDSALESLDELRIHSPDSSHADNCRLLLASLVRKVTESGMIHWLYQLRAPDINRIGELAEDIANMTPLDYIFSDSYPNRANYYEGLFCFHVGQCNYREAAKVCFSLVARVDAERADPRIGNPAILAGCRR
jgi:hypothetical protein